MDNFDHFIIKGLHGISASSPLLNNFMLFISDNDFLKGGIIVSILWFFWMNKDKDLDGKRKKVITVIISCLIAIAFGRLLTRVLPFRQRPVLNSVLTFLYPDPHVADSMDLASSMPSDHSVMFLALVTGIFLISKRIGLLSFIYVSCFVLLPRIYLGLHYPTDILAGGIVGILITLIISNISITDKISQRILNFSSKYSGIFYVLFFWLSFQIGTMFDSSRAIEHYLVTLFLHAS